MRAEIITAKCDRKECKTMIEVERNTVAPEGWLQVTVEIDGKWDQTSKLEFCSAKCVSIWARNRGSYQNGNSNGNSSRGECVRMVRDAVAIMEGKFTRNEIHEMLPEFHPDQISSALITMKGTGEIEVVGEKPTPGARAQNVYEIVKGGDA